VCVRGVRAGNIGWMLSALVFCGVTAVVPVTAAQSANKTVRSNSVAVKDLILSGAHRFDEPPLAFGVAVSTVGDRVGYSPNLPQGGFVDPVSQPRYASHRLSAKWNGENNLSLGGSVAVRHFTSLRDRFKFSTYRIDASYALPALSVNTATSLDISLGSNRADQLHKNSYTQIGDNLIKQVTVNSPNDLFWRATLAQEQVLTGRTRYGFFSGVGQTISGHRGLLGTGVDGTGCSYDFQLYANGGVVDQRDICGDIYSMQRIYPDESSIESDLQVAPRKDMQNNAWFYRVGGNLTTNFKRWQTRLSFYHQRYVRDVLDQRIRSRGGKVYDRNNVVSLQATRYVNSSLSYSATLEYNQHQFLDDLPVLYTRLTSDRFEGDVVYLTLQLNYLFGM